MFSFQASEWDQALSSRFHHDGAALKLPLMPRRQAQNRRLFVFSRRISYKLPDDAPAELEVILASSRIWQPDLADESRGWKVLSLGLGLILAIRLTVFPRP